MDKYTNETIPRKYFSGGAIDSYNGNAAQGIPPSLKTTTSTTFDEDAAMAGEFQNNEYDFAEMAAKEESEVAAQNVEAANPMITYSDAAMKVNQKVLDDLEIQLGDDYFEFQDKLYLMMQDPQYPMQQLENQS